MDKMTALTVFRKVVERNGFSAAASELGLSNAAVSKNVRELEAELGVRLLERTTRRISLTEAGSIYFERISGILDDLANADTFVTDMERALRGTLKVNVPMSMGLLRIEPLIEAFLKFYPEISVDLWMNDAQIDLVEHGFDVGVRGADAMKDSSLISPKIAMIDRYLCCSPGYLNRMGPPDTPEDLEKHDCLIYSLSNSSKVWTFRQRNRTREVSVSGRYRINNSIAIRDAARAGMGVALLPDFVIGSDFKNKRLVRLLPEWECPVQSIFAVYPKHREASRKLRVFLDFLVCEFGTR